MTDLAAADFATDPETEDYDIELYTFGAPAAGYPELMDKISELVPKHFSIENRDDIVPEVPLGYGHLDDQVQYEEVNDKKPSFFGNILHSTSNFLWKLWYIGKSVAAHGAYLTHWH